MRADENAERIRVLEYEEVTFSFSILMRFCSNNNRKLEDDLANALDALRRTREENNRPKFPNEDKVYAHFEKKYRLKMDSLKSVSQNIV